MITAFEVGSIFKIVDRASPAVRKILGSVTELDKAVLSTQKNLTRLSRSRLTGVGAQFQRLSKEALGFEKSLQGGATAIGKIAASSTALAASTTAITASGQAVAVLASDWQGVAVSARNAAAAIRSAGRAQTRMPALAAAAAAGGGGSGVPLIPLGGGGGNRRRGGRRGGGAGGGHGNGGGIHISNLGLPTPMPGGMHSRIHLRGTGTGALVGVGAGLFTIEQMMKDAKEPLHQHAMLEILGIDQPMIKQMEQEARQIAIDVPGSGYAHNLSTMGELYSIVGAKGALQVAPALAELDRVQAGLKEGAAGKGQGSAYVLTRAAELMGKLTDPVTHQVDLPGFVNILGIASRISAATHGKVTPEEWLNYAKQAGPAAGLLSENGLYTTGTIIQAMDGNRAGTAAAAIQRQFAGGVMTASKATELEKLGIAKHGDFTIGRGGHVIPATDAMKDFVHLLGTDPLSAIADVLIPALDSHGFDTNEKKTQELYRFLGTATEQREVYELVRGVEQIKQERERAKGVLGTHASLEVLNTKDPEQATSAFTTAFKDLLGALGGPLTEAAIPGMMKLTTAMNEMSKAASDHRDATKVFSSGLAGAAGGAAAGLIAGFMVAGPPGALAGAGGGALFGGLGGLGYGLWATTPDTPTPWWQKASTAASLGSVAGPVGSAIGGIAGLGYGLWSSTAAAAATWPKVSAGTTLSKGEGGSLNVLPPPQRVEIQPGKVVLHLDGKQIGEATVNYVVKAASGPSQGSSFYDTTRGSMSLDTALAQ